MVWRIPRSLKDERFVVLTVLPLQGEVPAEQAEGAPDSDRVAATSS